MKNELSMSVLAVCRDEHLYDRFRAAAPEGTVCLRAESAEQALLALSERSPDLVVVEHGFEGDAESLVRKFRQSRKSESSQYLVVATSAASAEIALLAGFDDAVLAAAPVDDLRLAIRAACLRRRRLAGLLAERDYLGVAVRREESLSRRLLEHHLTLEKALRQREEKGTSVEASLQ